MKMKMKELELLIMENMVPNGGASKLAFYDFDATLANSPMPDEGKIFWRDKTGAPWPHAGWWGRTDSLHDLFSVQLNPAVVSHCEHDKAAGAMTILLTNRIPKLAPMIKTILQNNGVSLDDYTFATDTKPNRVWSYVEQCDALEWVKVYDDDPRNLDSIAVLRPRIEEKNAKLMLFLVTDGIPSPY